MAQQERFVFVQDPARQPFYVRIGEHSYSSSMGGHLIVSPVRDSVYSFFVGFPRGRYPEQQYSVAVQGRDRGFELRQADGQWQLMDLLTKEWLKPQVSGSNVVGVRRDDAYSMLMADVVNDSAVLYSNVTDTGAAKAVAANQLATAKNEEAAAQQEDLVEEGQDTANMELRGQDTANVEVSGQEETAVARPKPDSVQQQDSMAAQAQAVAGIETKEAAPAEIDSAGQEPKTAEKAVETTAEKAPEKVVEKTAEKAPEKVVEKTAEKAVGQEVRDPRDIIRYITENVVEGKLMIYLDRTGPVTDTIRIIIPRL